MKKVTVLLHDYWHPRESIEPMLNKLFPQDKWDMIVTADPEILKNGNVPDLFVSFKDVIEKRSDTHSAVV